MLPRNDGHVECGVAAAARRGRASWVVSRAEVSTACAALAFVAVTSPARAEGDDLAGLELAGGPGATLFAGTSCDADSDTMGCTSRAFVGFEISPRWRQAPSWTFGALGAVAAEAGGEGAASSDGSATEFHRRVWRGEAEVAHWWGDAHGFRPWVGLGVGALALQTEVEVTGSAQLPESPRAGTDTGLALGAGLGFEASVGSGFALGAAGRVRGVTGLNTDPERGTTYTGGPWVMATVLLAWASPFAAPAAPARRAAVP